jgi:hypothetical protein
VIEVMVAEHQVLDLHRIQIELRDGWDDDVARVLLAVHRIEQDVSVVRRDQPRADARVADPVEVVEQTLTADHRWRVWCRKRLKTRFAVGNANRRPLLIRRATAGGAEDPEVELQIRIVSGERSRLLDVRLSALGHGRPLLGGRIVTVAATTASTASGLLSCGSLSKHQS